MKKIICILIIVLTNLPAYAKELKAGVNYKNTSITDVEFIGDGTYSTESAVSNTKDTMSVLRSTFKNNLNRLNGGGITNKGNATLNINNSFFDENAAANGGAIYINNGSASIKDTNFTGNNAATCGGAIYLNSGNLEITDSVLSGNTSQLGGGTIYIKEGTAKLDNTTVSNSSISAGATGGAIYNGGNLTIKNNSVFKNNSALKGAGGAITNTGTLNIENSFFDGNTCLNDGGAITSVGKVIIENTTFSNNKSTDGMAGAIISNNLQITGSTFENNSASTFGGAIITSNSVITDSIFKSNIAQNYHGGAIVNLGGNIELKGTNTFEGNKAELNGGAIYGIANSITTINSGSRFLNNTSVSGYGGAINTRGTLNINSANPDLPIIFSGNTDSRGSNAVHLAIDSSSSDVGTMNLNVSNGSKIIFADNISGVTGTKLNITGTSSLLDSVDFGAANKNFNGDITTNNINLNFYNQSSGLENAVISATNTHFNFLNGVVNKIPLNLDLTGGGNSISLDIDPNHAISDYINFTGSTTNMDKLIIRNINILSSPKKSKTTFDIFDHENFGTELELSEELKNATVYGGLKTYKWALLPKLTLIETGGLNPNIKRYQAATASAFMNQMLSYDYSLNRTDEIYTNLRANRLAAQKFNSYASIGPTGMYVDQQYEDGSAIWIRPYVNLETFNFSGAGGSVNNQSYGMMVGFDFPMIETINDWKLFPTFYGAYIGSSQQFLDSDMYQNGGYGGFLLSAFKDNFYAGWTINGGGLGVDSKYDSGSDTYSIVTAGTALKLAYNWKIFNRLILQPNFTTAYTFLNPANLVNFQSVDLNQTQVNGLTIAPSLRLTYRNESGYEPYIYGGCVIPIMSDVKVKADGFELEKFKLNAWSQFGAGVRKQITERLTCFVETVVRTGGRDGWGFMFNLQFMI